MISLFSKRSFNTSIIQQEFFNKNPFTLYYIIDSDFEK
jgi:hypothetical protein